MVTYQAHRAIAQSGDLRSVLAEFGGRQLGMAGDLANDFLNLVHGVLFGGGLSDRWKVAGVVVVEGEKMR